MRASTRVLESRLWAYLSVMIGSRGVDLRPELAVREICGVIPVTGCERYVEFLYFCVYFLRGLCYY